MKESENRTNTTDNERAHKFIVNVLVIAIAAMFMSGAVRLALQKDVDSLLWMIVGLLVSVVILIISHTKKFRNGR